jgi:hypothetical protein
VVCELLGVALGIYAGWVLCNSDWLRRAFRSK